MIVIVSPTNALHGFDAELSIEKSGHSGEVFDGTLKIGLTIFVALKLHCSLL